MTEAPGTSVLRWPQQTPPSAGDALAELLAAYHLCTEAEKGRAVSRVEALPDRYRAEVLDPRTAFAGDAVLLALTGDSVAGCLVVTAPSHGRCEVKRLWTDPAHRGRGVASDLIGAALSHAAGGGAATVRLSVWRWRGAAIALYERLGFTVTASWDEREDLVCMERPVRGLPAAEPEPPAATA